MAKKRKRNTTALSPAQLRSRITKAQQEGRFQQALELSRQLHAAQPTPANHELLLTVTFSRAQQLRQQGHPRDARTVLDNLVALAGADVAWQEKAAVELAAVGEVRRALQLLEQVPGSSSQARVLGHAADAAVQQGAAGKALLPEALHPAFDLVLQAFRQLEAGQDDAVRETLQGIGLTSPFLEWKLFLRGLQAYYQNEDARALENWSRLNAERVPVRLAAPFRFQIDTAFRAAQSPETQAFLRRQNDRLQGSGLVQSLRAVQSALHSEDVKGAIRSAEQVLPALRSEAPQLLPRLASCYYWAIILFGDPRDIPHYRRLFGAPTDDPEFARLEALAMEHSQRFREAHAAWQKFEKSLANNPAFPDELGRRARALVWHHLGWNADRVDVDEDDDLPPFLREHPGRPQPLKPTAEECFKRSLELAPDQLETHEALFHYYCDADKEGAAEKAARNLLQHFPEHVPTLSALGERLLEKKKYPAALDFFQRALKANPLDRRLRGKVSLAHQHVARAKGEAGDFDAARAEYQAAIAFAEGSARANLLVKWAALEFKADNAEKAEELLRQAAAGPRLGVAYQMVIEAHRYELAKPVKKRFDTEFADALAAPAEAEGAASALETAAAHRAAGVTYRGQKTHDKKLVTYLGKVPQDTFTEQQLRGVCAALLGLGEKKQLEKYVNVGSRRFPNSPHFPLLFVRSMLPTGRSRRLPPWYQLVAPLKQAEELARQHLTGDEQKAVLDEVERLRDVLQVPDGPDMLSGIFGRMFGGPLDDADADDDYDDDGW